MAQEPRDPVTAWRLSRRGMALYCSAALGIGFYTAFNNAALPLLIPSSNVLLVNLLSNTRSIEGTLIQPLIGAWSDRTWTPLGRRRPFMLAALPLSCLFLALTPLAPGLAGAVACIVLFSLCFNMGADPYTALEADIAPPRQRPLLNGLAVTVSFAGAVALTVVLGFGPFKQHLPPLSYDLVAAVLALTWGLTIATVREHRAQVQLEPRRALRAYLAALGTHRQAVRCLVAFFCYSAGLNVILVNLTPYAVHVLRVSAAGALQLFLLVVLTTGLCTLPAVWLAGRIGIQRVLAGGLLLMIAGSLGALAARSVAAILPCIVVAGIGSGAISPLTWPLLMQVVPSQRTGVFAGLKTSAESISAVFAAFVAAAMIGVWGYRSIFLALLVGTVCSLAALAAVRPDESLAEGRLAFDSS